VIKLILIIILFVSYASYAGNERGNGGDAILCDQPYEVLNGRQSMVLDLYESKARWNIPYDLGGPELKVDEKVTLAISRIKTLDPDRFRILTKFHDSFWDEVDIGIYHLPSIPDQGVVRLPGNLTSFNRFTYSFNFILFIFGEEILALK